MELRTPLERKKSSRKLKSALSNDDHGWTAEEDDLLRAGICDYGGKKWKSIAENIERWSPEQCKRRWNQLQSVGDITKRPWTPEEDKQMIALINAAGACKWAVIASYLPGRNGKQCRERWHNQLNPSINKSPWTEEENLLILRMQHRFGNCWAKITAKLPGRTDNAVKNHWHSSLKARAKQENSLLTARKTKAPKKARSCKSKNPGPSKKQVLRATSGDVDPTPFILDTKPVTRAASAAAAAVASLPQAKESPSVSADHLPIQSQSPDTVSTVDNAHMCVQPFDDGFQSVIDSILDPLGMGICDVEPPSHEACEMAFERSMANWRAGDDDFYAKASTALTPADPTSPAQPPFGFNEMLYDSLHDVCSGDLGSAALPLATSLPEITSRAYEYSTPDLSPLGHEETMRFQVQEPPSPVKLEFSLVEHNNFTPEISCAGLFGAELGMGF